MVDQDGLEWVSKTFGLEPRWTREPDVAKIELLVRRHFNMEPGASCKVTFHGQGAFNKLYKVEWEAGCALLQVTLPVDPGLKTNSEVATISFVRQNTGMPVPEIYAFDSSSKNELGFEWILMELLPGRNLRSKWRKLPWYNKQVLVKQIARYQTQMFDHKFTAIANLFNQFGTPLPPGAQSQVRSSNEQQSQQGMKTSVPILGQLVSMIFFWGDRINQPIARGPFTSSRDWIQSRLSLVLADKEKILSVSDDEDDIEEAQDTKVLAERLFRILPELFPPSSTNPSEITTLFHDDLSMQNILVDDDGKITGIIDWECVSALPLWRACRLPEFFEEKERKEKPERSTYALDNGETEYGENEPLDNEGINSLYWEHLMEWELTQLREIFLDEMINLAPEWIENMEKGTDKADFEDAVQYCDNSWTTRRVNAWLDAREKGEKWSLRKIE